MQRNFVKFALSGLMTLGTCGTCCAQTPWSWDQSSSPPNKNFSPPRSSQQTNPRQSGGINWSQIPHQPSKVEFEQNPGTVQGPFSGGKLLPPTASTKPIGELDWAQLSEASSPIQQRSAEQPGFRFPQQPVASGGNAIGSGPVQGVAWDSLPMGKYSVPPTTYESTPGPGSIAGSIPWEPSPTRNTLPSASQPSRAHGGLADTRGSLVPSNTERTAPVAVTEGGRGMIGPVDTMPRVLANQATKPTAIVVEPGPLAEPTSFGLIESYVPAPTDALATTEKEEFSLPPVEQIIAPGLTPAAADSRADFVESDVAEQVVGTQSAEPSSLIPMSLMAMTPLPVDPEADVSPSDRLASLPVNDIAAEASSMLGGEPRAYVLQDLQGSVPTQPINETIIPIDVLPLNRLVDAPPLSANAKLTTAGMTGPLTNAADLFGNLNLDNDYRQVPSVAAPAIRVDSDLSGLGPEWMRQDYAWVTPTFYHRPLYFEQENLERYGIGPNRYVQPVYSAAHFFMSIGLAPYKLTTQHPCEKVYTLGHNRPGDCVPYQRRSLLGQSYPLEACRYFDSYSSYR